LITRDTHEPSIENVHVGLLPDKSNKARSYEVVATIEGNEGRHGLGQSINRADPDPSISVDIGGAKFPMIEMGGHMFRAEVSCDALSISSSNAQINARDRSSNQSSRNLVIPSQVEFQMSSPRGVLPGGSLDAVAAGDPDGSGKFYTRVTLDPMIRGLQDTDFSVNVGGDAATILGAWQV
jgi:hypothetical protein